MKSIRRIKSIKKEKKRIEEEEEKKTFPEPQPFDFWRICASLGILQVTNATLRLCFFVSGIYLTCRQFLPNAFQGLLLLKEE